MPLPNPVPIVDPSPACVRPRRRALLRAGLRAFALVAAPRALAQSTAKTPRVAFVAAASAATIAPRVDAFRSGMKELGYVDGSSVAIDWRFGEEKLERIPGLVAQALAAAPGVFVSAGPSVTRAARAATATIPIVMAFDPDPVGAGFVASLARPGGNVTGMSSIGADMGSKQLEMVKQTLPGLKRVTVIGNGNEPGNGGASKALVAAAPSLGIELAFADVRSLADIVPAFRDAARQGAQAVIVLSSPIVTFHAAQFAEQSLQHRLPAVFPYADVVEAGGLMYYGVSITDLFRRAAGYVDRILRGARPAELPVEQPSRFDLVVNLKAARRIGVAVPAAVLARADRILD